MNKLDLHGVRHGEVDLLVENFIFMNQGEFPLEIICGNSDKMIKLVHNVTDRLGLETHMYRYGTITIRRWM
jgi:hypothetical protein